MFHATNVDLKVGDYLLPNNGRIYGTKEKWQCLIFGRNNDSLRDLGSQVGSFLITEAGGILGLTYLEHYPQVFENEFKGKSAYIYEVEDEGFLQGGWKVEYFKTGKAKIIKKYKVKDLYDEILKQAKRGRYKIDFYAETKPHIEKVIKHLMQVMEAPYPLDLIIETAKAYEAKTVEQYFANIKELQQRTINDLPDAKAVITA